jgi:hypothetical protein
MDDAPRLDDLIDLVHATAASDDPIDELAAAATLKADLDELTDALLGHFVDQARRAGCPWSQIGTALGVTKQAAQQRHTTTDSIARQLLSRLVPKGWGGKGFMTRFTPRARSAVAAAQASARALDHPYIGTEHLLLGLFAEPEAIAAKVLAGAGIDRAAVEGAVVEMIGRGEGAGAGHIPFTPRAKHCLELSLRAALELGHSYLGTEHLLLGLLREDEGVAAHVLTGLGLTPDAARQQVVRLLTTGI